MGCDIHSFAEVKKEGKWIKVKECFSISDFDKEYYKKEKGDNPFDWRSYGMFGFLADVRNYSHSECITGETRGLPEDSEFLNQTLDKEVDFSYWGFSNGVARTKKEYYEFDADYHSHSHIYLKELLDWDYEKTFGDRRISRTTKLPGGGTSTNGACLAEEGEGEIISYKDFLGKSFFEHIEDLKALGSPEDVRIVFLV